jgi:hypothetical protein
VAGELPKVTGLVLSCLGGFQATIEKLGRRKDKKERGNEEANSHVKCRVPADILGILFYRY